MTPRQRLDTRIAELRDETERKATDVEGKIRELSGLVQGLRSDRQRLDRLLLQSESMKAEGER